MHLFLLQQKEKERERLEEEEREALLHKDATSLLSFQAQYEETIRTIQTKRAIEALEKSKPRPPPARQCLLISSFCVFVSLLTALIIFLLYPRVPSLSFQQIKIPYLLLWSDGTAEFAVHSSLVVSNDNYVSTSVASMNISISYAQTTLGSISLEPSYFSKRSDTYLDFLHDFGYVNNQTFYPIFSQLDKENGTVTLTYTVDIITGEVFRLRSLHYSCDVRLLIDPYPVPPNVTQIESTHCSQLEATG